MIATRRLSEFFAQLADKDVDDFKLGLVYSCVKVVKEHFLCQGSSFAQAEQLKNAIFLAGEVHWMIVDGDLASIEIDHQLADMNSRFAVALGMASDRPNARGQLAVIERIGQQIIIAKAEIADFGIELGELKGSKPE